MEDKKEPLQNPTKRTRTTTTTTEHTNKRQKSDSKEEIIHVFPPRATLKEGIRLLFTHPLDNFDSYARDLRLAEGIWDNICQLDKRRYKLLSDFKSYSEKQIHDPLVIEGFLKDLKEILYCKDKPSPRTVTVFVLSIIDILTWMEVEGTTTARLPISHSALTVISEWIISGHWEELACNWKEVNFKFTRGNRIQFPREFEKFGYIDNNFNSLKIVSYRKLLRVHVKFNPIINPLEMKTFTCCIGKIRRKYATSELLIKRAALVVSYVDRLLGYDSTPDEKVDWPLVIRNNSLKPKGREQRMQTELAIQMRRDQEKKIRAEKERVRKGNQVFLNLKRASEITPYFIQNLISKDKSCTFNKLEIELLVEVLIRANLFQPSFISSGFLDYVRPMLLARTGINLRMFVGEIYAVCDNHPSTKGKLVTQLINSRWLNFAKIMEGRRKYKCAIASCLLSMSRRTTLPKEDGILISICDFVIKIDY